MQHDKALLEKLEHRATFKLQCYS